MRRHLPLLPIAALVLAAATACDVARPQGIDREVLTCTIPLNEIVEGGVGADGIPALTDPPLVGATAAVLDYLEDDDRVIGFMLGDLPLAVPHNILWWHEIVNFNIGAVRLAVTFAPLTGSSIVFDRSAANGVTFGVSGLLYKNNLIMYDRSLPESLWPQMELSARCGSKAGVRLATLPAVDIKWSGWRALHPDTRVVSGEINLGRNYKEYPYGAYDRIDNEELLFPIADLDRRRPLKERVLGVPTSGGGVAFPFGELSAGPDRAVLAVGDGSNAVVLWDGAAEGAMAYRPMAAGRPLTLEVTDGRIVDRETGSVWEVDGVARSGELAGERLDPIADAFVSFWFAWSAFHRDTQVWTAGS